MIDEKYIILNDGMKIPTVGFGTWKIGNNEVCPLIVSALEAGYRSIDTARVYENESGIGLGLKESSIPREEIYLTTKVWNTDQGYDATLRAMDASLARLQTSYVDLYLIHWPSPKQDKYLSTWKALSRLRKEGMAKSIGVCNFNVEHLKRLMDETGIIPALNQIELHPCFQQKELRAFHLEHNIATEAWSPLGRGKFFENDVIESLAKKYQKTGAQIMLRWHLDSGIIAIPKTSQVKRMLENLDIFDFKLDSLDLEKLNSLDDPNGRTGPDPMTASF